jgi:hypothetical protein
VADLAALRAADATGLTVGPWSQVVVVHVALGRLRSDRVDHLVHLRHRHREHVQDLGLTALEESRAVCGRDQADLGRDRAQIGRTTSVDAHSLTDHALAHELLRERANGFLDRLFLTRELLGQGNERVRRGGIDRRVAIALQCDADGGLELVGGDALDGCEELV